MKTDELIGILRSQDFILFSACDDDQPNGEYLDAYETKERAFAAAESAEGRGWYVAFDDTGESENNGIGPWHVFQLDLL